MGQRYAVGILPHGIAGSGGWSKIDTENAKVSSGFYPVRLEKTLIEGPGQDNLFSSSLEGC